LMVTGKVWVRVLLVAWPSLTVTVRVAVPLALASGVKVRVPVPLGLVSFPTRRSSDLGLLEAAVRVRVWTSLLAPEVMPDRVTVCRAAYSFEVQLLNEFRVGVSFTALTVTEKVRATVLLRAPLSLTVTVRVAVALASTS